MMAMIPAIVLAAGLSRRMGRFKLTLPWGRTTVIGQVVSTLVSAGLEDIIVVTGHRAAEVEAALIGSSAHTIHNPHFATGEMLSSVQAGLRRVALRGAKPSSQATESRPTPADALSGAPAALLSLGDQPQMEMATVRAVLAAGAADDWQPIVVPSYQMRAGHPILLPAWLWPEIITCVSTLRDVLAAHRDATRYLTIDTPSVLADLDTPEDYEAGG